MILDGVTALRVMHVGVEGYEAACAALRRTTLQDNPLAEAIVREIIADVRARGDAALLELGRRFDAPELSRLEVPPDEWSAAEETISSELREAMLRSAAARRSAGRPDRFRSRDRPCSTRRSALH